MNKTKNASSFTWTYLIGNLIGQIFLIAYGVINKAWGIYVPTILIFISLAYISYVKYHYAVYSKISKIKE